MPVAFTQVSFRGRNDDGDLTTATWKATTGTNWSQTVDVNFRVRFDSSETGSTAATLTPQLQCNKNGGTNQAVTGSSTIVRSFASSNVTDGAATGQIISAGTFVAGSFDEADGLCAATASIDTNQHTEHEFCIRIQSADVVAGDTINLRLVRSTATAYGTYTASPAITVLEPTNLTPGLGNALAITGKVAALKLALNPAISTLAITGKVPTVQSAMAVSPAKATLTTTTYAAALRLALNPAKATLTITGKVPALKLSLQVAQASALAITGKVPALKLALSPAKAALAITGYAATLKLTVSPAKASLAITGKVPTLRSTLSPAKAALAITGKVPTVTAGSGQTTTTLTPAKATLSLTGTAAALRLTLSPATAMLTTDGKTPALRFTLPVAKAAIAISGQSASVFLATTLHPAAAVFALTGWAPSTAIEVVEVPWGVITASEYEGRDGNREFSSVEAVNTFDGR